MPSPPADSPTQTGRHLPWPAFIGIASVYVVIIQGYGLLFGIESGPGKSPFPTAEVLFRNALIPIGLSIVFGAAVVSWLGWWSQVMRSDRPTRRWVRWVPISMLVGAVVAANYGRLAEQPWDFVLCLVLLGVFVGVGEELMFRGIGVNVFRRAGFTEGNVALWSSVAFGLVHVSNAIGAGPQALVQAVLVSTSGYFFYLCLRAGGTLLLPMVVHGSWDFSLFSSLAGQPEPTVYAGMGLIILLQLVLIVVTLHRRKLVDATALG